MVLCKEATNTMRRHIAQMHIQEALHLLVLIDESSK